MTALGTAAAVRRGERAAVDVVEEHLAAIAGKDGEVHAFLQVTADEARATARRVDEPMANSSRLVLPTTTAPASRSRVTTVAS